MYNYLLVFILFTLITSAYSIMFLLQPNTKKCLREELRKDELIIGSFEVSELPRQQVIDSKNEILARKEDITKGKFTVVVDSPDIYEVCFKSTVPPDIVGHPHEIKFTSKLEVKSYEAIGIAQKLIPMEVELGKLEGLARLILRDFETMKEREVNMSNTNESIHHRILWFSIFGAVVLSGLTIGQLLYLRKFFKARKLIQ